MDWHQINYFQKVASVQHITRAAEQLSISQPALSRSISKLEDELGVQLFDRKGRNIYLNRYGKMFLNRVEQSIKQIEIGKQEIWDEIHPDHGTISLSFLPSLGIHVVPSRHNKFISKNASEYQVSINSSLESANYRAIKIKKGRFGSNLTAP
ncbi:LysR family transcriptional regulator [Streptomyces sp. ISL-14]|nr:LysR family transcriptional regulator [Bacillus sp. ISL-4]MBT2673194.1 LysR family transcriptional regulator [Streptomyces sp. ISL-14]